MVPATVMATTLEYSTLTKVNAGVCLQGENGSMIREKAGELLEWRGKAIG
jgi:hypothetical protein